MSGSRSSPIPRRFELVGGSSLKFWEVIVHRKEVTVCFGRIGTAGQRQTRTLTSEAKAAAHAARLIREKRAEGYQEVGTPKAA
jgi:predicted DNA-binding WGR domain protein